MKRGKIACRALAAACETQHIVYVFLYQYSQVDLLVVTASSFCCCNVIIRVYMLSLLASHAPYRCALERYVGSD